MDWFHATVEGIRLFESGAWFIGGLVLCLIGGLLTWDALAFRRRAYRVTARILGVIPNTTNEKVQAAYHPVYEFETRDGERLRVKSRSAANLARTLPGTQRTLLCDSENKYELRSTQPIQLSIGVVLFFVGVGLFKIARVTGRNLLVSGSIAAGMILLWILHGIYNARRSGQEGPSPDSLRVRLRSNPFAPEKFEMTEILTKPQHWRALLKQDQAQLRWMPLFLTLTIFLFGFGGYRGYQRVRLMVAGERAEGRVVRIDSQVGTDNEPAYYSVVEFTDTQGRRVKVRDNMGSSSPVDRQGDMLQVIYDPGDPEWALIDRGFWSWLLPVGLCSGGFLTSFFCVQFFVQYFQRRHLRQEFLSPPSRS